MHTARVLAEHVHVARIARLFRAVGSSCRIGPVVSVHYPAVRRVDDARKLGQRVVISLVLELLLREVAPSRIRRVISSDASRDPEFRQRALQLLEHRPRDAQRLNAEAWNLVCFAGGEAAAYARGLALAEAAEELLPQDGYVLNTLGCAQYRNALFTIAYDTLKRAAEKNGSFPPDHSLLACVCVRLGRIEEARAHLARAEEPVNGEVWGGAEPGALLAEARNLVGRAR